MLAAAGIDAIIDPPNIDEGMIKKDCKARGLSAAATADALAVAKAAAIAARHPGCIVLGADQMLECDGEWFDKPSDRAAAIAQIGRLSGKLHTLFSATAAMRDGEVTWRSLEMADLTVRPLSAAFIESYVDRIGDALLSSVGGYQMEGLGIQLFSKIVGEHSTILGMPLLPLLEFLRGEGVIVR